MIHMRGNSIALPVSCGVSVIPIRRVHGSPMGGTTGVSLEQGLGLTDIPRGRPGRRPGDECSSSPDYYFIIDENKSGSPPGSICLSLGFLVPRFPWIWTSLFVEKQDHVSAT